MHKRILLKDLHLSDINPRVCGIRSYASGDFNPPHPIHWHILHYVTMGKGIYRFNGQELPVRSGDIFVSHPGYLTSYLPDPDDPFTYIWVGFDCIPSFEKLISRDVFPAPWSGHIFEQMLTASETTTPEWAICARLYDFFVSLVQQQPLAAPQPDDYVSRAVSFIKTNYSDTLLIADIAGDLGLSRHYFCRIFKQQMGVSPQEYLVSWRMSVASRLLTERRLPQKEVALQVGYPDVYAFSRMFKRKYGVAPGVYAAQKKA